MSVCDIIIIIIIFQPKNAFLITLKVYEKTGISNKLD